MLRLCSPPSGNTVGIVPDASQKGALQNGQVEDVTFVLRDSCPGELNMRRKWSAGHADVMIDMISDELAA